MFCEEMSSILVKDKLAGKGLQPPIPLCFLRRIGAGESRKGRSYLVWGLVGA